MTDLEQARLDFEVAEFAAMADPDNELAQYTMRRAGYRVAALENIEEVVKAHVERQARFR